MTADVELRCCNCNALLFKYSSDTYGHIEIVCKRCGDVTPFIKEKTDK